MVTFFWWGYMLPFYGMSDSDLLVLISWVLCLSSTLLLFCVDVSLEFVWNVSNILVTVNFWNALSKVSTNHSTCYREKKEDDKGRVGEPSSCLPNPLSSPISIVHRSWQVIQATYCIGTELLYIGSCWSSYLCSSMNESPPVRLEFTFFFFFCLRETCFWVLAALPTWL